MEVVFAPGGSSYQGVERGHGEDSQASQHALGGPTGHSKEALGVWELAALQAGQVTAQPEQIQVQFLQVLLPLLNLNTQRKSCSIIIYECCRK